MNTITKIFAAIVMFMFTFTACNGKRIDASKLPDASQQFVSTHFSGAKILLAEKEDREYELVLDNGVELEFFKNGNMKKVDVKTVVMPQSVMNTLPPKINAYLAQNYTDKKVKQIKIERNNYEIELSGLSDLELIFSKEGDFIRLDK